MILTQVSLDNEMRWILHLKGTSVSTFTRSPAYWQSQTFSLPIWYLAWSSRRCCDTVPTRRRSPAAGGFSSFYACLPLQHRALQGHKELLLCRWGALPNTSDATLTELLMKGQDVEQVVSVLGDPPHFPAADARLILCLATVAFMSP